MGREVRMVPPNWEHPKRNPEKNPYGHDGYQPMFDERFEDRFASWLADFDRIRAGNLTEDERGYWPRGLADWLTDEGAPPDPDYYRPWADADATWFQIWETVSEGTPVAPPFATAAELARYLAVHGDFWDQKRGRGGWGIDAATRFVSRGWAPSFIAVNGTLIDGKLSPG